LKLITTIRHSPSSPFEVRWRNIKIKDLSPDKTAKSQAIQFTPAPDVKKKPPKKKKTP